MQISVSVKHGSSNVSVSLPADGTVLRLKELLEEATGVFTRKQKIIFKGKVLDNATVLKDAAVGDGAKLMLLAQPIATKDLLPSTKPAPPQTSSTPLHPRPAATLRTSTAAPTGPTWDQRLATWRATGVLSARALGLQQLPPGCFAGMDKLTTADLSLNALCVISSDISRLQSLRRLSAASNQLKDSGVPWTSLALLPKLAVLKLEHNMLTALPAQHISLLTGLTVLTLDNNRLAALPDSLAALKALTLLSASGNLLSAVTPGLAGCSSLVELDLSRNELREIPKQLSALTNLQHLLLDANRIHAVPSCVLSACVSLNSLSLANNPVTADQLAATPGWQEYDGRRRARADKQIEMNVLPAGGGSAFSEGADGAEWQRM